MTKTHLKHFSPNKKQLLPATESWPKSHYLLDERSAYALEMALLTGRPLLVKGEPGTGKSQLARAAAAQLERLFVSEVVNVNTEGQDLLWRYDPIARLNDAQIKQDQPSLNTADYNPQDNPLHPCHYVNPGVLWWVFNWSDAKQHYDEVCTHKLYQPQCESSIEGQASYDPEKGCVLLIDEIDKADPSLPNSLLEVLGNGGFKVPLLNKVVKKRQRVDDKNRQFPLIIITTNDERELPPAFLRRCLVLNLTVDDNELESWLIERAMTHFDEADFAQNPEKDDNNGILQEVAYLLKKDRIAAKKSGLVKPGLAEFIDLLQALKSMTPNELTGDERYNHQHGLLEIIKPYALSKA